MSVVPGRRRAPVLSACGLAVAVVLSACGGPDPEGETAGTGSSGPPTRVVDHAGGSTTVVGAPERVVVLDSGELDAVTSLGVVPVGSVETEGLLEELAAVHGFDASTVQSVGAISEPNLEAVAALDPDLILTNAVRDADRYEQLSAIAPTVMAESLGATWKENFRLDAQALGVPERAEEVIAAYEQRADAAGDAWGDPSTTEINVLRFVGGGEIRAYARGSFVGSVLNDVGFVWPAATDTDENRVELSAETIGQADADVLFWSPGFAGGAGATEVETVFSGELWRSLAAVQAGAAHEIDDDRWFLGLGPTGADLVLDDLAELAPQR